MTEPTTSGISRRTLAKGAAWAVPAVAVAAAAPAYAQSVPEECITVAYSGDACKEPGNSTPTSPKAYRLGFTFTNTCATGCVTIVVTSVFKPNGSDPALYQQFNPLANPYVPSAPSNTFQVCAGVPTTFTLPTTYSPNSSNGVQINFTVNGVADSQFLPSPPDCVGGAITNIASEEQVATATEATEAEGATADQAAADQAAAEKATADKAAADQAAADEKAAADKGAAEKAAADKAAAEKAAADKAAAEKAAADKAAAEKAAAEKAATEAAASPSPSPTPEG